MLYAHPTSVQENVNMQNKRTCKIVDFAVSADHRIKLIESEKMIGTQLRKLFSPGLGWALGHSCRMGYQNQCQIRGRKAPSFG